MVSFNTGSGAASKPATTNSSAADKKTPKSIKVSTFTGDARAESVLHKKVITSGTKQSGQIIAMETALSTYAGEKLYSGWAESIRNNERKSATDYMPAVVDRINYSHVNAAGDAIIWDGATYLERVSSEDRFNRDNKLWDSESKLGINNWNKYEQHGEALFLVIKGQVEPSLWDKTKDDPAFAGVEALKCPIALLNLLKVRCTGTVPGVWGPLVYLEQVRWTLGSYQNS